MSAATIQPEQGTETDGVRDMLRDSARDFASARLQPNRLRVLRDAGVQTHALWMELAGLGWTGLMVDPDHGGSGLGLQDMAVVLEEMGRVAAPEPLSPCAVFAAKVIAMGDQPELQATLLQGLANGTLLPAVAWQESQRLGEPGQCLTRASRDGDGWRLQGAKCFIRPGAHWDGLVVSANTGDGCALFWVPRESAGLTVMVKALADGSQCADVLMVGVHVKQGHILASSRVAAEALAQAMDFARLAAAAELLGVIRGALEVSVEYLRTREQFGVVIGSFQALRHRAVEILLQRELVSASLEEACRLADEGAKGSVLAGLAARVKARASSAALQATKDAVQFHGAMGYTDECDVGLYLKRALTLAAWLGGASELLAEQSRTLAMGVKYEIGFLP